MLNIPNEIITLCKTDSVRKNFRVHFPNGENADLTNSDIVAGTVQFTESISSKDVLQFGLAESPRIQFECVNVLNIYGMEIECGIEIDTSSLTPAEITSIQGNPGDGVLVLEADSDIGYGYYRIPYGTFTVTSCPRSAGAMWRRRVEAYGSLLHISSDVSWVLSFKESMQFYQEYAFKQNLPLLIAGEFNDTLGMSFTESTETFSTETLASAGLMVSTDYSDPNALEFYFSIGARTFHYVDITNEIDSLYRFTCTPDLTVQNQIIDDLLNAGMPSGFIPKINDIIQMNILYDNWDGTSLSFQNQADSGYIYPYLNRGTGYTPSTKIGYIDYPAITITKYVNGHEIGVIGTYTIGTYITNPVLKKYALDSGSFYYRFKSTGRDALGINYTCINAVNMSEIINSFYELYASFYVTGRLNESKSVVLSKSSPVSINTDEYSDVWWDDFSISPIGSIKTSYYDVDLASEQTFIYEFGDGLSQYDMTSNYLLKNFAMSSADLGMSVQEYIISILDSMFIPNISDIAFTPAQLASLGLPYLETGDYLEIDDGNNGTVGTYILNRTISGEQFLSDDIESQGGEIIGNARNV